VPPESFPGARVVTYSVEHYTLIWMIRELQVSSPRNVVMEVIFTLYHHGCNVWQQGEQAQPGGMVSLDGVIPLEEEEGQAKGE
jgi:hypothetical protein